MKQKNKSGKSSKPVYKSFLYLMPMEAKVSQMADSLTMIDKEQVEVWIDYNLLEITTEAGTITFEDYMGNLHKEDERIMAELGAKQLYACEYNTQDRELVQTIMQQLIQVFGGHMGSDTENFEPFLKMNEL